MDTGNVAGIVTAMLLLTFLGVVAWAWSGRRKHDFDAAARLPLDNGEDKSP
jgi:cytochrome c oxidase cbb3-type subunit 4